MEIIDFIQSVVDGNFSQKEVIEYSKYDVINALGQKVKQLPAANVSGQMSYEDFKILSNIMNYVHVMYDNPDYLQFMQIIGRSFWLQGSISNMLFYEEKCSSVSQMFKGCQDLSNKTTSEPSLVVAAEKLDFNLFSRISVYKNADPT